MVDKHLGIGKGNENGDGKYQKEDRKCNGKGEMINSRKNKKRMKKKREGKHGKRKK